MTRPIVVGTVIAGTLRNQDLLEAFTGEIEYLTGKCYIGAKAYYDAKKLLFHYKALLPSFQPKVEVDESIASEVVNELLDALNEYAPFGMYFGTLEGDGADFGWFVDHDLITEMLRTAQATCDPEEKWITDCDCQSTECANKHGYIIQVNDHGNMTLMDADRKEVWSIV